MTITLRSFGDGRPRCPACSRVIQPRWPEDVGAWCVTCGNPHPLPKPPEGDEPLEIIQAANDADLMCLDFTMALARKIDELDLSRKTTPLWLYETLFSWKGLFCDGDGRVITIRDRIFDDAFGEDSWNEWFTNIKRFAHRRPLRRPKSAMRLRFLLWDLAWKVRQAPIELPTY